MKKLVIVILVVVFLAVTASFVLAQATSKFPPVSKPITFAVGPVFYGEWRGAIWMYWDGPVNSSQPGYAYYQNLNTGQTGVLELAYYSHDTTNNITWWKSSGIVCGKINYYQVIYSFYQVSNVPLIDNRFCSFLPMIRKQAK